MAAVDDDEVGTSTGDVQITVEIDTHVPGAQPIALSRRTFRMAARAEP